MTSSQTDHRAMLELLRRSGIHSQRVLTAMAAVPREEFVQPTDQSRAYADRAMAIECGQTISQPLMVALLVEALELQDGDRVLDVGTGSGYQAAVISACGVEVHSIERIPELADHARARLQRLGFAIDVRCGDGGLGEPDRAPFDGIAVAAALPRIPVVLAHQLAEGGRLVAPIRGNLEGEDLTRLTVRDGRWETENLGPCQFVPLIGVGGYQTDGPI